MMPLRILHVEDDPDDSFFFSRAIRLASPDCELHQTTSGEGAIDFLAKAAAHSSSNAVPDAMVLDLKLPGLSGFEVLSWTRCQAAFTSLPVILLSGSSLVEDKKKAFELGATRFMVKHSRYDQIAVQILEFLGKELPTTNHGSGANSFFKE